MSHETVINFRDKLEMSPQHWSPRIAARVNDAHFELRIGLSARGSSHSTVTTRRMRCSSCSMAS